MLVADYRAPLAFEGVAAATALVIAYVSLQTMTTCDEKNYNLSEAYD